MAFKLNCLEPLTAFGAGLAACMLPQTAAVGAIAVSGVALFTAFRQNARKHGLDEPALFEGLRLRIFRDLIAPYDRSEVELEEIQLADAAMAEHLPQVMLSGQEIANLSTESPSEPYFDLAARLIVDRLAELDGLFAAPIGNDSPSLARRFATDLVCTALDTARKEPVYAGLVTVDLLIAGNAAHAHTHAQNAENGAKLDEVLALLKINGDKTQGDISAEQLRREFDQLIQTAPNADASTIFEAIRKRDAEREAELSELRDLAAADNLIRSAQVAAEQALEAGDDTAAIAALEVTEAMIDERLQSDARISARLASMRAAALLRQGDVVGARATWQKADAALRPFDVAAADAIVWDSADALLVLGDRTGGADGLQLLEESIAAYRGALTVRTRHTTPVQWAITSSSLANALQTLGGRRGGHEGARLLAEAVNAYQDALSVRTRDASPAEWAVTKNNLANALQKQSERIGGEESLRLLRDAITEYENVLTVRTRDSMPLGWATTMSNLAGALKAQSEYVGGEEGLRLLAEAVAIYKDTLSVLTFDSAPVFWAKTMSNFSNALQRQGEQVGGEEGSRLLTEAIAGYRKALTAQSRDATSADWAGTMNNLAIALQTQGDLTSGEEGIIILAEAVTAYRDALTVRTRDAMPADWAITMGNLANTLRMQGERTYGEKGYSFLTESVATCREALTVQNCNAMRADWAVTMNNLAIALSIQGERSIGDKSLHLLAEAVDVFREVLVFRSRDAMPARWAKTTNNLATALRIQGERMGGEEGRQLLVESIGAYRDTLTVYSYEATPTSWATTMINLAHAHESLAYFETDPSENLRAAEAALSEILVLITPDRMPYHHNIANLALASIREKQAELPE